MELEATGKEDYGDGAYSESWWTKRKKNYDR
jgi:hypothetical protein